MDRQEAETARDALSDHICAELSSRCAFSCWTSKERIRQLFRNEQTKLNSLGRGGLGALIATWQAKIRAGTGMLPDDDGERLRDCLGIGAMEIGEEHLAVLTAKVEETGGESVRRK